MSFGGLNKDHPFVEDSKRVPQEVKGCYKNTDKLRNSIGVEGPGNRLSVPPGRFQLTGTMNILLYQDTLGVQIKNFGTRVSRNNEVILEK